MSHPFIHNRTTVHHPTALKAFQPLWDRGQLNLPRFIENRSGRFQSHREIEAVVLWMPDHEKVVPLRDIRMTSGEQPLRISNQPPHRNGGLLILTGQLTHRVLLQKTRPRNCKCLVWRTLVFS